MKAKSPAQSNWTACLLILTAVLALMLYLPPSLQSQVKRVVYRPGPDDFKYTFGQHRPVMKIKPGTVIETLTEDCYDGRVKMPGDLPTKVIPPGHDNPQTGPFYIEGAEPGDTLVVHLLSLEPTRDYGISSYFPGFGILTPTKYTAMLNPPLPETVWWYRVDKEKGTVRFEARQGNFSCELPIKPFLGCLGVAPADNEARTTVVPEAFGGNLDSPEVRPGHTIYLPVNVRGALLFFGDGHLIQGDGEIIGTAVEAALKVELYVDLVKNRKTDWPRIESDDYLMSLGSYRPLEDAFRIAHKDLLDWLMADYGLEMMDAYQLLSQVGEARVAQVVDPNYTVVARFPKKYLPPARGETAHEKIRRLKF
ncbi:MAG: acetamidase/formamidase family protein [Candidatus Saccharicenans sp.]|nr:acetamidase/formamidase family protein [Candidatus Saccharicenans sp.]MDH7492269.1 acetamidase/formamidase family protein [Candidatus Saccharicenans sp.]